MKALLVISALFVVTSIVALIVAPEARLWGLILLTAWSTIFLITLVRFVRAGRANSRDGK
ncbi:antibiotic biosynthesis monooxygenase (ABM) superfamily enzyme [Microbacterium halimionae]|uniref:Antibiotic biosynthesis monooxygenase (ABM) superfamily enzyme n=1 Tax=Microbacterium halimionae TaxID=1526413 RepID=A0A7W3JQD0_9MICO|nr:hypothetical protein [Microbacterium halimionae]MBA8817084.1 antibiotic biosynthesis monooxygenase (ABM) superfamily enzyme [Microbacterium halimionae]NII94376.1 antibiotic biosynthesis monooxygenase (ABM) superfamily enzyme [Microbacterium halimionae]